MQYLCRVGWRPWFGAALLAALLFGLSLPAEGQQTKTPEWVIVYLQDGFAIQGYVKRESANVEVDPFHGVPVTIPTGFFLIDDGPRRIAFAPNQVARVDVRNFAGDERVEQFKSFPRLGLSRDVPAILDVVQATPFDQKWERQFRFRGKDTQKNNPVDVTVAQHVGMVTPYSIRVDTTTKYMYSSAYLTHEFSPEVLQELLVNHASYAEDRDTKPAEKLKRRLAFAQFMSQAGYFDLAEQSLERSLQDLPASKEVLETQLRVIGEHKARESFEAIKRLAVAGQLETAMKRIKTFPEKLANEEMLAKMRELKADYETALEHTKTAQKFLKDLPDNVPPTQRALFREAADALHTELCIDNVNRLDTFLSQTEQYERLKKDGKKTEVGPTELLSLATSSWLLGSAAGETKYATAERLWKTRQLVLQYEKTNDLNLRQRLRESLVKDRNQDLGLVEEVAQLIPNLPPTEPGPISKQPQKMKCGHNTTYELQLPPEYRHGRHYPVLIVLHQTGEKPREQMERWQETAADNGYILVAPEWEAAVGKGYTFSDREHQIVLETIRDLRRKYRVDSDRVFLFGLREGGTMAIDVGQSHPDLFAGVSTMGAGPEMFSEICWHNQQALPFYVVNGDRVGKLLDTSHRYFTNVIGKHFPTLWVQYKGRGTEWFGGEVPLIFDWMRVKRCAFPMQHLGDAGGFGGCDFNTMRPTDNSFYWLTTNEIMPAFWNSSTNFRISVHPATLQGTIDPLTNDIRVTGAGIKQVSVWLGRNSRGESMIDFSKPVTFRFNNKVYLNKDMVKPNLGVLLDDLYNRGDRQRVFFAKLSATQ